MDNAKEKIKKLYFENVHGNSPNIDNQNSKHDGAKGHWLEKQLGKEPDGKNEADFWGYECKNHTTSGKTTWGDWTPNYYIFDRDSGYDISRDAFLMIFGKPNAKKNNRLSWSGEPVPRTPNKTSNFGQYIVVDDESNINIYYDFSKDLRKEKNNIVPLELQKDNLLLAKWNGYEKNNNSKKTALETKVKKKFDNKGWFKCAMENNIYTKIIFGKPVSFETWIEYVKSGDVYFDSGMYQGNIRPYSQWRSDNIFWDKLVIEEFPKDN
tara:strand:- start:1031 stop:1828 length:798 start_codon:yes stop_codon:yes gene_type:complete